MKSFKILFIIGCMTLALVAGVIIANAIPENTVDFNGTVTNITEQEDGTYMLTAEAVFGGEFRFIIDGKSDLENCCDEDITIGDISVGGTVLISYRKTFLKKNDIQTVKSLTFFTDSENENGN